MWNAFPLCPSFQNLTHFSRFNKEGPAPTPNKRNIPLWILDKPFTISQPSFLICRVGITFLLLRSCWGIRYCIIQTPSLRKHAIKIAVIIFCPPVTFIMWYQASFQIRLSPQDCELVSKKASVLFMDVLQHPAHCCHLTNALAGRQINNLVSYSHRIA